MAGEGQWRNRSSAQYFADHDYADFAQEFLRRNVTYQSELAAFPDTNGDKEDLAGKWGLRFPL